MWFVTASKIVNLCCIGATCTYWVNSVFVRFCVFCILCWDRTALSIASCSVGTNHEFNPSGANLGLFCGDLKCSPPEESSAWCQDCFCGDGICDVNELDTSTCATDCATGIIIVREPFGYVAGLLPQQPYVAVTDASGQFSWISSPVTAQVIDSSSRDPISAGSYTFSGCGIFAFTDLRVDKVGVLNLQFITLYGGVVLTSLSTQFTLTFGSAHHLNVSQNPSGILASAPFNTQPKVQILDVAGNIVENSTIYVTASVRFGCFLPEEDYCLLDRDLVLQGGTIRQSVGGTASFVSLFLPSSSPRVQLLFAARDSVVPALSSILVVAGVPRNVAVLVSPQSGTAAGEVLDPQPVVALMDGAGLISSWFDDDSRCESGVIMQASLLCGSNTDSRGFCETADLYGNKAVLAQAGISNFTDLSVDRVGFEYSIQFELACGSPDVNPAISALFNVSYGIPFKLDILSGTSPNGASPGCPLTTQPQVMVQDKFGNVVGDAKLMITAVLLEQNALSNHSLKGDVVQKSCESPTCNCDIRGGCGVARWVNLQVNDVGVGFSIEFVSTNLITVDSFPSFDVLPGSVHEIFILVQPSGVWPGKILKQQPVIGFKDVVGNFVPANDTVQAELIITKPGGLVCSLGIAARAVASLGKAIFTDLNTPSLASMDILCNSHSQFLVRFSFVPSLIGFCASSLIDQITSVDSSLLYISSQAQHLVVSLQPENSLPGQLISPTQIDILDKNGTVVTWYDDGPLVIVPSLCVSVDCPSGSFQAGLAYGQPCFVCANDQIHFCQNQTQTPLALRPELVATEGFASLTPIETRSGIGIFANLRLYKAGTYRFQFDSYGFSPIFSQAFTIFTGSPAMLSVLVQPEMAIPGQAMQMQPVISMMDVGQNLVTSENHAIVTAVLLGTKGNTNSTLLTVNDVTMAASAKFRSGVSEFQGLRVDRVGQYRIVFNTDKPYMSIESEYFYVKTGRGSSLWIVQVPDGCTYNLPCAEVPKVEIHDAGGNLVLNLALAITASLISLSCSWQRTTAVEVTISGTATFAPYLIFFSPSSNIDHQCNGTFQISFTCPNLTSATSREFPVSWEAMYLQSRISPLNAVPGSIMYPQPQVFVTDHEGQLVRTAGNIVSVNLLQCTCSNTSCCYHPTQANITLLGLTKVVSNAGSSIFTDLRLDRAGFCYRLLFQSNLLSSALSGVFDVAIGASLAYIAILQYAYEIDVGATMQIQPRVAVMDKGRNIRIDITGKTVAVMQYIRGNPIHAQQKEIWSGGLPAFSQYGSILEGQVLFTDLRVDFAYCCLALRFVYEDVVGYTDPFIVNPGPLEQMSLMAWPSNGWPGFAFETQPVLGLQDRFGNFIVPSNCKFNCSSLDSDRIVSVRICKPYLDKGQTILGHTSVVLTAGIAIFTDLRIDSAGNHSLCFRANVSSSSVLEAVGNITIAPAVDRGNHLSVLSQPFGSKATPTTAGSLHIPFDFQPIVGITDIGENVITVTQTSVTVSIFDPLVDYTGGLCYGQSNCPLLSGNTTITTVRGIATFTDLSLTPPCKGLVLQFSSGSQCSSSGYYCTPATTQPFDVSGAIANLIVAEGPTYEVAGTPFAIQPQLKIIDDRGRWYTYSDIQKENVSVSVERNISGSVLELQPKDILVSFSLAMNINITCIQRGQSLLSCFQKNDLAIKPAIQGNTIVQYSHGLAAFSDLTMYESEISSGFTLKFTLQTAAAFTYPTLVYCCVRVVPALADKLRVNSVHPTQVPGDILIGPAIAWIFDLYDNFVRLSGVNISAVLLLDGQYAPTQIFPISGGSAVAVDGTAVFSELFCYRAGSNFSFNFVSGGLKAAETNKFSVSTYGKLFRIRVSQSPDGIVVNTPFQIQPILTALDKVGNLVDEPINVSVSLVGSSVATLISDSGLVHSTVQGQIVYTDLRISVTGLNFSLRFCTLSEYPILSVDSEYFDVADSLIKLEILNSPSREAIAGQVFAQQPLIKLSDSQNRRFCSSGYTVTAMLGSYLHSAPCMWPKTFRCSNPDGICSKSAMGCPQLLGNFVVTVVSGYGNFTDLRIGPCNSNSSLDCSRGMYRISFVLNNVFRANYSMVVDAGQAIGLAFGSMFWNSTIPAQIAGVMFSTQPQLFLIDAGGNVVSSGSKQVGVSLVAGRYKNRWEQLGLQETLSEALCSALATYCPCIEDVLAWQKYSGSDVALFANIVKLHITSPTFLSSNLCTCPTQPDCFYANCSCNPTWSGSKILNSANGSVFWSNLAIQTSGFQYQLQFSLDSYLLETIPFTVFVGTGTKLQILIHPDEAFAGLSFLQQPQLAVVDSGGNLVVAFIGKANADLLLNDDFETLQGTKSLPFIDGIVSFSDMWISKAKSCYIIKFTSLDLEPALSRPFNVSLGKSPYQLSILESPEGISPGYSFQKQPVIAVQDAGENYIQLFSYDIQVVLTNFSGSLIPFCSFSYNQRDGCQTRIQAVDGIASFTNLRIDIAGNDYIMVFKAVDNLGNVVPVQYATLGPFSVQTGSSFQLSVVQQPSGQGANVPLLGQPGRTLVQQPAVVIQDAGGNALLGKLSNIVSASLYQNGLPSSMFLFPPYEPRMLLYDPALSDPFKIEEIVTTGQQRGGEFFFTGLRIDRAAANYTIRFNSLGLLWVESIIFSIQCGPALKLAVSRAPFGIRNATYFLVQPIVTVQDRGGNVVYSDSLTVVIASLSGPTIFNMGSNLQISTMNGYAQYTNLGIYAPGNGFILTFSSRFYTQAMTLPFNVSGLGSILKIVEQPSASFSGIPFTVQPIIEIVDDGGRLVDSDSHTIVTASLWGSSNFMNATLSGKSLVPCCWGYCRFTDLSISKAGEAYKIEFSTDGMKTALSSAFRVDGPSALLVKQSPEKAESNLSFGLQPVIIVVDDELNLVSSCETYSCSIGGEAVVFASLVSATGGQDISELLGTKTAPIFNGVAYFTNLGIRGAGGMYGSLIEPPFALKFTSFGLLPVNSSFFNLTYPKRPPTGYVKTEVRVYGIPNNYLTPVMQINFMDAISKRLAVGSNSIQIMSIHTGTRRSNCNLPVCGPHSDILFFVWSNSSAELLFVASSLSSWLERDGAFATALSEVGLPGLSVDVLLSPVAVSWDGSVLQAGANDNTSSVIGGVVGGFFGLILVFMFAIMWIRAKNRAKIRNNDMGEVEMMRAIGMQDFADDIEETALLPWTAEKMLGRQEERRESK